MPNHIDQRDERSRGGKGRIKRDWEVGGGGEGTRDREGAAI